MQHPGTVPEPGEAAVLMACQMLVVELFARIDQRDIDGAAELYAEDAVFLHAEGRAAIHHAMDSGTAMRKVGESRHVITNLRSEVVDERTVRVEYTAVAYTLEGPGPYPPRSVFDQEQLHHIAPDGAITITRHRIPSLEQT